VAEIIQLFNWFSDVWGYFLAVSTVGLAGHRRIKRILTQVYRVWNLSNRLHLHYGPDAAAKIIAKLGRHSRDLTILAAQQELVEMDLDLAVFICDASGEYSCVNSRFSHLFGLDREECEGRGWLECILPAERERVHKTWTYATSQKLAYDCHITVQNKSTGHRQRCLLQAKPWFSDGLMLPDIEVAKGDTKAESKVAFYLGTVRPVKAKEVSDATDSQS